jgi:ketosteroid isomerase-like protein
MSRENIDLIRTAMFPDGVDLVSLPDRDLVKALDPDALSPDIEVAFATPGGPLVEYRGLAGFLEGWRDWLMPWASYQVQIGEMRDAGDRVVALVTLSGRTSHDGVEITQPGAAVFTVSGGKIVRVEFHLDQREALAAAGLSR